MGRVSDRDILDAISACGTATEAAARLGIARSTLSKRLKRARENERDFQVEGEFPSSTLPTDEIIKHKIRIFEQKKAARLARSVIDISVKIDGPFGIAHMGDPHIDNNGCNWPKLLQDLDTIQSTEGLFGATVGDITDNWVGRLAAQYANSNTTENEAKQLVEWFIAKLDPIYLVGGNHDVWHSNRNFVEWFADQLGVGTYKDHGIRIRLKPPRGRVFTGNVRHEFKGHSQYNPAFGPGKAAWRGHDYDFLACGHRHTSGYTVVKNPANGRVSHCFRVSAYKEFDDYADRLGFDDHHIFQCPMTIHLPEHESQARSTLFFFDVEEGSDYLNHIRRRHSQSKSINFPKVIN